MTKWGLNQELFNIWKSISVSRHANRSKKNKIIFPYTQDIYDIIQLSFLSKTLKKIVTGRYFLDIIKSIHFSPKVDTKGIPAQIRNKARVPTIPTTM